MTECELFLKTSLESEKPGLDPVKPTIKPFLRYILGNGGGSSAHPSTPQGVSARGKPSTTCWRTQTLRQRGATGLQGHQADGGSPCPECLAGPGQGPSSLLDSDRRTSADSSPVTSRSPPQRAATAPSWGSPSWGRKGSESNTRVLHLVSCLSGLKEPLLLRLLRASQGGIRVHLQTFSRLHLLGFPQRQVTCPPPCCTWVLLFVPTLIIPLVYVLGCVQQVVNVLFLL